MDPKERASSIADRYITKEGTVPIDNFNKICQLVDSLNLDKSRFKNVFANGSSESVFSFLESQEGRKFVQEQDEATGKLASMLEDIRNLPDLQRQEVKDMLLKEDGVYSIAHLIFVADHDKVPPEVVELKSKQIRIIKAIKELS
jgi:hypothetical protein